MNMPALPLAVRAIAAAFAVFMTTAMLSGVVSIAEPQRSQLMAHNASHRVTPVTAAPLDAVIVAEAPASQALAVGCATASPVPPRTKRGSRSAPGA